MEYRLNDAYTHWIKVIGDGPSSPMVHLSQTVMVSTWSAGIQFTDENR